jgi:hypothetical protein
MNSIRFLILKGFPVLMFTDLGSDIFSSEVLLNIGRLLRTVILLYFVFYSIFYSKQVFQFKITPYIYIFLIIQFFYLFTDRDFFEGFWIFSKMLFWGLGCMILYLQIKFEYITYKEYTQMLNLNVVVAAIFSVIFFLTPTLTDYNLAAYTVLFMYPLLLYNSNGFKNNTIILLIASIAILISLKRGALVAFSVSNLIYFLYSVRYLPSIRTFVVGLVFFAGIIGIGVYMLQNNENVDKDRFSEDQFDVNNEKAGSGRVGLYTRLYEAWDKADLETKIYGFGNQADSWRTLGRRTHAHSDIFGFIYNHGYLGIFMILLLYLSIFQFYQSYKRYLHKSQVSSIAITFIILVLVNLYSGLLRSQDAIYLFAIFPIFQGLLECENQEYY